MRSPRLLACTALLISAVVTPDAFAQSAPRIVDRIVAIVDHEPLLLSDLVTQSAPAVRQANASGGGDAALAEIYRTTLEAMVDARLVEGEAKKRQIEVAPDEVDRALDSMFAKLGLKSRAELLAAAAAQGMDEPTYRGILRAQILEYKVLAPALTAARESIPRSAVAERLAALRAKNPKATEADAEDSLHDEAYAAVRARVFADLRRGHYVEVRL